MKFTIVSSESERRSPTTTIVVPCLPRRSPSCVFHSGTRDTTPGPTSSVSVVEDAGGLSWSWRRRRVRADVACPPTPDRAPPGEQSPPAAMRPCGGTRTGAWTCRLLLCAGAAENNAGVACTRGLSGGVAVPDKAAGGQACNAQRRRQGVPTSSTPGSGRRGAIAGRRARLCSLGWTLTCPSSSCAVAACAAARDLRA